MNTAWHITGLFGLLSLSLACTGGGDSGADTPVSQGGGQDDYGVEIPVATSLTLADFGYSSSDGTLSDITNAAETTMSLTGESTELAYMAANTSPTGDYVIAILSPTAGESCSDFIAALASSTKTEAWLSERRFYLQRSSFKAPENGSVALRVDTTAPAYQCSALLAAQFLPVSKGYQGHGGSVAFVEESGLEPDDGSDPFYVSKIWSDQAGLFSSKEVDSCGSSDPMNPQPEECESSGTLSLSWAWDTVADTYRFLIGQGFNRSVIESVHKEWVTGSPLDTSNLGKVNSTAGSSVGGLAMRTSNASVERLAFMKNGEQPPTLYEHVGDETWTLLTTDFGEDSDAWSPRVMSDGSAGYIDDLGSSYRVRLVNLFEAADAGNISSALTGQFSCYPSSAGTMQVQPVSATEGYFLLWCPSGPVIGRLDSSGFVTTNISTAGTTIGSDGAAIAASSGHLPEVFFAGSEPGEPPADPTNFQRFRIYRTTFDQNMANASTVRMTIRSDDGSDLSETSIESIQVIKDHMGRTHLLVKTNKPGTTSASNLYLGTVFPSNEVNLVNIGSSDGDHEMSISNMILYGRDL